MSVNISSKDERLLHDINNIITSSGFYGTCEITKTEIRSNILWIGTNGYTASIGQWIRFIWDLISSVNPHPYSVVQGFKWFTVNDIKHPDQRHWYFGFKLTRDGKDIVVACGGATDYSGEGGHGKELADRFMRLALGQVPPTVLGSDYLISILTGGI